MKNQISKFTLLSFIFLLPAVPSWAQRGAGRAGQGMCLGLLNAAPPKQALSADEAAKLAYIREEEKLARDVYSRLQAKWGLGAFGRIAQAEERHFSQIKLLLDRYQSPDPAAGAPSGQFQDSSLQLLYGDLASQGDNSLEAALKVGAAIEELGVRNLEKAIAETDNSELKLVYGNLKQASENHLRAFVRQLQASGERYAPQYLGQETFSVIAGDRPQTGRGMGTGYGARGNGQRGRGRGYNGNCPQQ